MTDTTTSPAARSRAVAVVVLLMVAAGGILAGIAMDRLVLLPRLQPPSPPFFPGPEGPSVEARRRVSDRVARELDLTPEQQTRVDVIMDRQFAGMAKASSAVRPVIDSTMRATQAALDSVFTPEQQAKVRAMRERMQARRPPPFPMP